MEASQIVFICGLLVTVLSLLCAVLSFSLDSWLQNPFYESQFGLTSIGLWKVCFQSFYDATLSRDRNYYGCHWIYSDYVADIRWPVLNPPWFVTVQILAIINLVMSLCGVASMFLVCCFDSNKCPLIVAFTTNFFMTLLGLAQAGLFGVYARDNDFYAIPNVEKKEFGPGWYFSILSGLTAFVALVLLLISYLTLRREHRAVMKFHQSRQR